MIRPGFVKPYRQITLLPRQMARTENESLCYQSPARVRGRHRQGSQSDMSCPCAAHASPPPVEDAMSLESYASLRSESYSCPTAMD